MKKMCISLMIVVSVMFSCFAVSVSALPSIGDIINSWKKVFGIDVDVNLDNVPSGFVYSFLCYPSTNKSSGEFYVVFTNKKLTVLQNASGDFLLVPLRIGFENTYYIRYRNDGTLVCSGYGYGSTNFLTWNHSTPQTMEKIAKMNYTPILPAGFDETLLDGIVPSPLEDNSEVPDQDEDDLSKFKDFIPLEFPDFNLPEFDPSDPIGSIGRIIAYALGYFNGLLPRIFGNLMANLKILMENILKFPAVIVNQIKAMFTALFVPRAEFLGERIAYVSAIIDKKFPLVVQIKTIVNSLVDSISSFMPTQPPPKNTITLWGHTFDFINFPALSNIVFIVKAFLCVFIYIKWGFGLAKRLPSIIGGVHG